MGHHFEKMPQTELFVFGVPFGFQEDGETMQPIILTPGRIHEVINVVKVRIVLVRFRAEKAVVPIEAASEQPLLEWLYHRHL